MAKNNLGKIEHLAFEVEQVAGENVSRQLMDGFEALTAKSTPQQVTQWVKQAIQRLDEAVDEHVQVFTFFDLFIDIPWFLSDPAQGDPQGMVGGRDCQKKPIWIAYFIMISLNSLIRIFIRILRTSIGLLHNTCCHPCAKDWIQTTFDACLTAGAS